MERNRSSSNQPEIRSQTDQGEILSFDPDEARAVLRGIVAQTAKLLFVESIAVLMFRPSYGDLIPLDCSFNLSEKVEKEFRLPLHQGTIGQVFREGNTCVLTGEETRELAVQFDQSMRNALVAPLDYDQGEGEATQSIRLGVVVAWNKRNAFESDDSFLMHRLAKTIAQSITVTDVYKATRETVTLYEAAIRSMHTGFLALNSDGIVYQVNSTMGLLGITPESIGKPYTEVFRDLPPFLILMIDRVLKEGTSEITEISHRIEEEEGIATSHEFRIQVDRVHSQESDGGKPLGVVLLMEDITFLKEQKIAEESMVPVIAHDIRNPLAAVNGNALTLLSILEDPELDLPLVIELVQAIHESAVKCDRIINDFLDISRLASGQPLAIEKSKVELPSLLAALVEEHKASLPPSSRIQIKLECDTEAQSVIADKGRIEQVVLNFLSNAVKYSPEGGTVTVRLQSTDRAIRVSVSDEGIGIPPEALPNMFGRMYRVESDKHKTIKGTGLGLYLSKNLIEAQGGVIGVESEYGKGSTFFFDLPK